MMIGLVLGILHTIIVCLILIIVNNNSRHANEIKELKKEIEQKEDKIVYAIQRLNEIKDELKKTYEKLPDEMSELIKNYNNQLKEQLAKQRRDFQDDSLFNIELFLKTFDKDIVTEDDKKRLNVTYEEGIKFLEKKRNLYKQ